MGPHGVIEVIRVTIVLIVVVIVPVVIAYIIGKQKGRLMEMERQRQEKEYAK